MPENKREPEFTVTDRRRFTVEGESGEESVQQDKSTAADQQKAQQSAPPASESKAAPPAQSPAPTGPAEEAAPEYPNPTPEERHAQEQAFKDSTRRLDTELKSTMGSRAEDLQMTFERFVASIYMSALLQLGLMHEQNAPPPPVDLVGARQTIDTLSILSDKTKGNLTMEEENLLQNCLYELRMAYVEVTNALTRAPQPGQGGPVGRK